jgi:phosphoglycolate phosphatase-like HAD superfamily hydrolase
MDAPRDANDAHKPSRPRNPFFVGVDSDGCAFDTMDVKHKECFIPNIVKTYRQAAVSKYVREAAEFINLYSRWRGVNRFPGLVQTFDLVRDRPEIAARCVDVPRLHGLRSWLGRAKSLSNSALRVEVEASNDPDLATALAWSEAVNASIAETVTAVPPFPYVRESLQSLRDRADVTVVSATPAEALEREWAEHGLTELVDAILGQERGSKAQQLAAAAAGRYAPDHMLMVGDAPGDLEAARAVGALFYPIEPGRETDSWWRFLDEALPRFLAGAYAGGYMSERVAAFERLLPETPPWQTPGAFCKMGELPTEGR